MIIIINFANAQSAGSGLCFARVLLVSGSLLNAPALAGVAQRNRIKVAALMPPMTEGADFARDTFRMS